MWGRERRAKRLSPFLGFLQPRPGDLAAGTAQIGLLKLRYCSERLRCGIRIEARGSAAKTLAVKIWARRAGRPVSRIGPFVCPDP